MFRYLVIAFLLSLMSACGGGGSSGSSAPSVSNGMSFSPSIVSFDSPYGGSKTFSVTATPSNPSAFSGISPLVIQVVDSKGVLKQGVAPYVTIDKGSAIVSLSTSSTLPIGNYQGNFQIVACANTACTSQLSGSPWSLPYNFNVKYILDASSYPTHFAHIYDQDFAQSIDLTIHGTGLNWSVTTDVPWLQSTVSNGSGFATLRVNANVKARSMTIGDYKGNIIITSTDGQSVSQSVTLHIYPETELTANAIGSTNLVTNAGTNAFGVGYQVLAPNGLTWTLSSTSSWLIPHSASGSIPGYALLDFQSASLAAGSYSGSATLRSSDGQTIALPVSLTVYGATVPLLLNYSSQNTISPFMSPSAIVADSSGNLFVGDFSNDSSGKSRVRKISTTGMLTTFFTGATYPSTPVLNSPEALATDSAGNLYIGDGENSNIIKVTPDGTSTILADIKNLQTTGLPQGLAVDAQGNIYISDGYNRRISKLASNGAFTILAKTGSDRYDPVTGTNPTGLTLDPSGNVIVADERNCTIKKVTQAGEVTVLAGQPGICGNADGNAKEASFNHPRAIIRTGAGDYYIADTNNNLIRKLSAQGIVTTIAGTANKWGVSQGPLPGTLTSVTSLALVGSTLYFTSSSGLGMLTNVP